MLPKLECVKLSGVKPSKFEFKNFLALIQNCVIHLESNEVKLTLLKATLCCWKQNVIVSLSCDSRVELPTIT